MQISVGMPVYVNINGEKVKGRVCKVYPTESCCVQLEDDLGCYRYAFSSITPGEEPAPVCSEKCISGC